MHPTESTALVRVSSEVRRSHRTDMWTVWVEARAGDRIVLTGNCGFDAAYWSAQAVEAVLQVLTATLEAAYEL